MRKPLRILLVDDSIPFLQALRYTLRMYPDLTIVGCAQSGRDALDYVTQLQPDVVVMDIAMPEMNGLEATRLITGQSQAPVVVILTMNDNAEYRAAAAAAGAAGFINKAGCDDELPALLEKLLSEPVEASQREGTPWNVGAVR